MAKGLALDVIGPPFKELGSTLAEAMGSALPSLGLDSDKCAVAIIWHNVVGHSVPNWVEGSTGLYGITRTSKALLFPGGLAFSHG